MKLDGPDRFELRFTPTSCTVVHPNGVRTFRGRSAQSWPKLYVAVAERKPIYVGVTRQSLSKRLRLGWNADGASGYHGYAWRHKLTAASLMVWYADADRQAESQRELETIEAEIVFAIRLSGQWPADQTEIHFYPSDEDHRRLARDVLDHCLAASSEPTQKAPRTSSTIESSEPAKKPTSFIKDITAEMVGKSIIITGAGPKRK